MAWGDSLAGDMVDLGAVQRATDADVYRQYRATYGRHASRQLAADMGISRRTARRALAGAAGKRQFTQTAGFIARKGQITKTRRQQAAADIEAAAAVVDVGRVPVYYGGEPDGFRTIGIQDISD